MRFEILVLTRKFEKRANLRLPPGGSKPESKGMFQAEVLWSDMQSIVKGLLAPKLSLWSSHTPLFHFYHFVHFFDPFHLASL